MCVCVCVCVEQRQLAKRHGAPLELSCANVCIITFQFKLLYLPLSLSLFLSVYPPPQSIPLVISQIGKTGQFLLAVAAEASLDIRPTPLRHLFHLCLAPRLPHTLAKCLLSVLELWQHSNVFLIFFYLFIRPYNAQMGVALLL